MGVQLGGVRPDALTTPPQNIPIDVCKIYGPDAVFLQQACHLTSGSYFKIQRRAGLLQYLIVRGRLLLRFATPFANSPSSARNVQMTFLPGPSARRHLTQPTQDQVDLRAACFCHRKIVDIGYVCSVCLSSKSLALERFGGSIVPLTRLLNSNNRKQSSAPQSPFAPPVGMSLTSSHPPSPRPLHSLTAARLPARRTKFPMATLKRLGFGAKPPGGANGAPRVKKRKAPGAVGTPNAGGTPGPGTPA